MYWGIAPPELDLPLGSAASSCTTQHVGAFRQGERENFGAGRLPGRYRGEGPEAGGTRRGARPGRRDGSESLAVAVAAGPGRGAATTPRTGRQSTHPPLSPRGEC